jgi:hypothetical protein
VVSRGLQKISGQNFGRINSVSEFDLTQGQAERFRLRERVGRIIAKLAEDHTGDKIIGDEEYDIEEIMLHRINHRPIYHCKMDRERERIIFIFDSSGSCEGQSRFYRKLLQDCIEFNDVEVYDAPNGGICAQAGKNGRMKTVSPDKFCGHYEPWNFKSRTIVFFGDYDAGRSVVMSSWRNKVYFFCSEDRFDDYTEQFGGPLRMDNHPWAGDYTDFTDEQFRGKIFLCRNEIEFLEAVKKLR